MVKNSILVSLAIIGLTLQTKAQDRFPVELRDNQFYVTILEPGVAWETKLSDNQSFRAAFGLTQLGTDTGNDDFGYSINPTVSADFRNFYARKRVKKDLNPNSGNYVGLRTGYNFGAIADNVEGGSTETSKAFFMGAVWGIQRNYQSGIHLGLSFGPGFAVGDNTDLTFTGIGQFQIGFAIGK